MHSVYIIFAFLLSVIYTSCKEKESGSTVMPESGTDSIRIVKSGLSYPWEILWGQDNHIWMTERGGKISRINPANGSTVFSFSISEVESRGEGGLLGMAFHPDFLSNGYLFVAYNYDKSGEYIEKLVRYTF